MSRILIGSVIAMALVGSIVWLAQLNRVSPGKPYVPLPVTREEAPALPRFQQQILANLNRQIKANLVYDGAYTASGKPKPGTGVCSDVVLGAAHSIGIDLQKEITLEIKASPVAYGVERGDPGIDHRRCRTMIFWFRKHAESISSTKDFRLGDVVFYQTSGKGMIDHVGVIGGNKGADGLPTLVHHWPGQPVTEIENPMTWTVAGHFRFRVKS